MTSSPSRARSSPRGREEYDPQGMLRDDYDSSPQRVRHDYDHSSQSRVRNDYDQARNDYGEYERARTREEYERHSPQTRARDYSPSRGLKDDYPSLEEYESSQTPRRREDVGENGGDEDEEIDFDLEETTTTPTAPSSVRVLDDYGDSRLRSDFDYDPAQSIRRIDDYSRREDYPHNTHVHHRSLQHNNGEDDDYRCPEGDYEGYGRHYRDMMEPASPSLRSHRHLHPHHHHQHQHHHHHHPTDSRQVSQQKCV